MTCSRINDSRAHFNNGLIPPDLFMQISKDGRFGQYQKADRLGILPIIGEDTPGNWTSPYSGLKFTGVHGYGSVSFRNDSDGTAIIPMHMGYIQAGAQNHAVSAASILGMGQERRYDNARCVQASQGGFLKTRDQWFFILPLILREEALANRRRNGCGVLWDAIGRLGSRFGSTGRGHLDDVICKYRATLNVYDHQFELLPHQVGAIFFLDDQPVGIEIGPTAKYFADIWTSLLNFCYGSAALELERTNPLRRQTNENPKRVTSLETLRGMLQNRRYEEMRKAFQALSDRSWKVIEHEVEESFLDMNLFTVRTADFYGQVISNPSSLIYASMFRVGIGA